LNNTKLTSFSAKDWQVIPVQSENQTFASKPMRSCCSAKHTKDRLVRINHARRMMRQRKEVYKNARHIDETLVESSNADIFIPHPIKTKTVGHPGIDSKFSNSFMNSMFRDTSLNVAQKQKEAILRDQQNKIEKQMKRRQMFLDNKQKISLREYYRKEHGVKVNQKVMDSLSVTEFEEYLKRRHLEMRSQVARKVLERYLLGFVCKYKFKKSSKRRHKAATVIQNWFRTSWRVLHGSLKKKRQEATKTISAYLRSYLVFMQHRDELYKAKLKNVFLFFGKLREGLLCKAQTII
jgi:hypothetical protein